MVHHSFSTVGLGGADGCPGALRKGDIYTHTYHGFPSTLVETDPATEGACVQYRFVEQIARLNSKMLNTADQYMQWCNVISC
jgi:hypothetical protein